MPDLIICRLEQKLTKLGPYSVYSCAEEVDKLLDKYSLARTGPSTRYKHPAPWREFGEKWMDLLPCRSDVLKFGFENLGKLQSWFPLGFIAEVSHFGIHIAFYQVPAEFAVIGKKQVLFDSSAAKEISHV